jgi:hypothetical protein
LGENSTSLYKDRGARIFDTVCIKELLENGDYGLEDGERLRG